eukprot:jgi/Mesvir1/25793/Mv06771-RA.1
MAMSITQQSSVVASLSSGTAAPKNIKSQLKGTPLRVKNAAQVRKDKLTFVPATEAHLCADADAAPAFARRQFLAMVAAATALSPALASLPAGAALAPSGFNPLTDIQDGYSLLYPVGWQEVVVKGQDVVYKDVIEPLENVAVNIIDTTKSSIEEFGPPELVAETLVKRVLTPPEQTPELLNVREKVVDGRKYYVFEFKTQATNKQGYVRHQLGVVTVSNGRFFTVTAGCNEKRFAKLKEKLAIVIDSFTVN